MNYLQISQRRLISTGHALVLQTGALPNKVTSVGPSFNVLVDSQNIRRCQRIQHSMETGEVPSSSLQEVRNSCERE